MNSNISNITQNQTLEQASSAKSLSQLGEDYSRFLTLLTAQISYQDPLAPMDSTQFVSQLAQLSQVEQAVKTNSNLETLQAQMQSASVADSVGMIGREVVVPSSTTILSDGQARHFYQLPQGASSVVAEIVDPLDRVVKNLSDLPTERDILSEVVWDGKDEAGNAQLEGAYTVKIKAYDGQGELIPAYTYREGVVEEVLFADGRTTLGLVGGERVPGDNVYSAK